MNYRNILKTTYNHIKSKKFRSYLNQMYRNNINTRIQQQELNAWQALLAEISRQQSLAKQPRGDKFKCQYCLINFKGFQLQTKSLKNIRPDLLKEVTNIFMRVQINYIHSMDNIKDRKKTLLFRLFSIIDSRPDTFFKYYSQIPPQQKLGSNTVKLPPIGKWKTLFDSV